LIMSKYLNFFLKHLTVVGLIVTWIGILGVFLNLLGYLRYPERVEFSRLVDEEGGIPLYLPAAQTFMRTFPAPVTDKQDKPTYIVKNIMKFEGGGQPVLGTLRYMYPDGTRSSTVATFDDIRRWASESRYPWLAWWIAVFGVSITTVRVFDEYRILRQSRN